MLGSCAAALRQCELCLHAAACGIRVLTPVLTRGQLEYFALSLLNREAVP